MVLPLSIRYTLSIAKRRWTVEVSLSALVAVLVFLMGVLLTELAGDVVPVENPFGSKVLTMSPV